MPPDADYAISLSAEALETIRIFDVAATVLLPPALCAALDKANQLVLRKATIQRFTGKGPFPISDHRLGVRTNRLRSSLRAIPATFENGLIRSQLGSNVVYFGIHEFGFHGTVKVAAHRRIRYTEKGQVIRKTKAQDIAKKGGNRSLGLDVGISQVRAHDRRVNLDARAPLSTAIEESLPLYAEMLSAAALQALGGKA